MNAGDEIPTRNDNAVRPHDWLEADRMVDEILRSGSYYLSLDAVGGFHRGIRRMIKRNMPFDDGWFREMLEHSFRVAYGLPITGIVPTILSEDVNAHPIDRFRELLSCMRMHRTNNGMVMKTIWHAHELMRQHNITEYDDDETGVSWEKIITDDTDAHDVFDAASDDEIILRAKLIDTIMRSCGDDDIDIRKRTMMQLSFTTITNTENITSMLAAVRSYSASEPDYHAALSVFDDCCIAGHKVEEDIIWAYAFRRILKSCDGNPNAMSGFMHAAIELATASYQNRDLFHASYYSAYYEDFDAMYPEAMRLTLTNLAEGYPIEYITELIISERDSRDSMRE